MEEKKLMSPTKKGAYAKKLLQIMPHCDLPQHMKHSVDVIAKCMCDVHNKIFRYLH
jgi:hypothetical protein